MADNELKIQLRKQGEAELIGPMGMEELCELAQQAYVGPGDEVTLDGRNWIPAKDVKELEMVWLVWGGVEALYGPTTSGTLREFLSVGEVDADQVIRHAESGEETSLRVLLGEEAVEEIQTAVTQQQEAGSTDPDLEESVEIARDIRIQHLETELEKLRKDYDSLMQQFRRTSEELLKIKGGK